MGIPLLKGREFTEQDGANPPLNVIISESFARRYWPDQDPIGKRFIAGTNNPCGTVVGVVGNVRNSNLQEEPQPAFYFPYGYVGMPGLVVAVRTTTRPDSLAKGVRAQVRDVDSEQPIYNIRTMNQVISSATAQPRLQTMLLFSFSTASLLLAAIGIYGLMAYLTGQRRREIGIRMAIGADANDMLKLIITEAMRPVLLGTCIGLAGSLALTRLMKGLLFGVTATDPASFITAALSLIGVALVACYFPARRAVKVDPFVAFRQG